MALTAYQAHMKRELTGKMKGKTAAQRKAIFKAAAKSYKKPSSSKPKARVTRAVTRVRTRARTSTGGRSTMGKKNGFNTQKIFKLIRMGALIVPAAAIALSAASPEEKIHRGMRAYFGVRPGQPFSFGALAEGWMPFLGATVVTYGIPKIAGILRSL